MATVLLTRDELEAENWLPPICVCCGADATTLVRHKFSSCPMWVYVLGIGLFAAGGVVGLVVMLVLVPIFLRRVRTRVPVCASHRGHWRWRRLVVIVSLCSAALISGTVIVLAWKSIIPVHAPEDWFVVAFLLPVLMLILTLIPLAAVHSTAVRAAEIVEEAVFLTGVARRFSVAVRIKRGLDDVGLEPLEFP